jgi:hypothetical protein
MGEHRGNAAQWVRGVLVATLSAGAVAVPALAATTSSNGKAERDAITTAIARMHVNAPLASIASAAPRGGLFAGFSSQRWPSFFRVAPNNRTLAVAAIGLGMTCTSGNEFGMEDDWERVPVNGKGRFRVGVTIPPTTEANGAVYGATDSVSGTVDLKHGKVSGVWQFHVTYTPAGGQTDQCDSGPVAFTARQ